MYTVIYRTGTRDNFEWKPVGSFYQEEDAQASVQRFKKEQCSAIAIESNALESAGMPTTFNPLWTDGGWYNTIDDDLGYKLAMIMITGHNVRRYEGSTTYLEKCLVNIKAYLCPDMDIDATAKRMIAAIDKADATWETFFKRKRRILCSWCKSWVASDGVRQMLTDAQYAATTKDSSQSHGMCKQCADAMSDELDAYRRKEQS